MIGTKKSFSAPACLLALLSIAAQGGSCGDAGNGAARGNRGVASAQNGRHAPGANMSVNANGDAAAKGGNVDDGAKEETNNNPGTVTDRVPPGVWGGMHVRLMVREDDGSVEFDCARGTIDGPLNLDGEGRFDVRGTFVREHPGPIRLDVPRVSRPARYSGKVTGDEMSLTVTLTDTSEVLDALTLTRGGRGRVVKCR